MKPVIRNTLIGFVVIIVAALLFMPGKQTIATDLSFADIDGKSYQFSDYQGKPLLVIFWATDCPGCIQEMPELVALRHQYKDSDFAMLGVAMPHDKPNHIQAMRQQKQLPYTLTWDQSGEISKAFDNVRVTPTHFLISAEGEIIMRKIGTMDMQALKQRLAMMGVTADNS